MRILKYLLFLVTFTSSISIATIPENLSFQNANCSSDSLGLFSNARQTNLKRIHFLNASIGGSYGLSMYWLYTQWYKNYPGSSFHFFNDNKEWKQMDKFAHMWDGYLISKALTGCYRWAGYDNLKSLVYGSAITCLYQTTIEVFDGFSKEWGFSSGDILANTLGLAAFTAQELKWGEQRITLKLSFQQTKYSTYRPQLLGKSLPENILKDYNGLTNWICINPHSFFKSSKLPPWLSIAIGFGAEGMTGGEENLSISDGKIIPYFERYRQYYLSVDLELSGIKTNSAFLASLFKVINIIHLPSPAIELRNGGKPKYHAFYF